MHYLDKMSDILSNVRACRLDMIDLVVISGTEHLIERENKLH